MLRSKAPPGLAQMTIDLWLRWGRANEWMLKHFRCHILDAVRRRSEHAMQGLLLGVFWDIPGYDPASCVRDLANLGTQIHISSAVKTAARMIRSEDTNPEHVRRGISLWKQALRMTTGKEALRGFGWWVEVPTIESEEWGATDAANLHENSRQPRLGIGSRGKGLLSTYICPSVADTQTLGSGIIRGQFRLQCDRSCVLRLLKNHLKNHHSPTNATSCGAHCLSEDTSELGISSSTSPK